MSKTKRGHPLYYNEVDWICPDWQTKYIPKDLDARHDGVVWTPKGKKYLKRATSKANRRKPIDGLSE